MASITWLALSSSFSFVKDLFPILTWIPACLSDLNSILPALTSLIALATSALTVPAFGVGIRPRGPKIFPNLLKSRIISGVAITTSKSINPLPTFSIRSSAPIRSAPASLAFCSCSPLQKTAMRTFLPVPCGKTTVPRITWSELLVSILREKCNSTVSSNFTLGNLSIFSMASLREYVRSAVNCCTAVFMRLLILIILDHHLDTHAAGRSFNSFYGLGEIHRVQIFHFGLGDLFNLFARDLANFFTPSRPGGFSQIGRPFDQDGARRSLDDKIKRLILVNGNDRR